MKYENKRVIVSCLYLFVWPFGLMSRVMYKAFGSEATFYFFAQLLSLVPGKIGQYIRTAFYKMTLTECHYDLMVGFCSFFSHPAVRAGRRVGLGSFSIVDTSDIGDNVMISSRVSISNNWTNPLHAVTPRDVAHSETISIGAGCWIGEGAIIEASLGKQCVVSAGSVITKPSMDRVVAIGNPARFLRIADNAPDAAG